MTDRPSGSRTVWGCATSLLVVILLVVVALPSLLRSVVRRGMSPAERAFVEQMDRPPGFPASWADAPAFSPATRAAMESFGAAWKARDNTSATLVRHPEMQAPSKRDTTEIMRLTRKLAANRLPANEERESLRRFVEEDRELTDALLALVNQPDYDVELWGLSRGSFPAVRIALSLALARARFLDLDGETSRGLALATAFLPLVQRHPAGAFLPQYLAFGLSSRITATIAEIASRCDDADALLATIDAMERVDARVNAPMPENVVALEILGQLRALKREGFPVDIDLGRPVADLYDKNVDAHRRYPAWKLMHRQSDDPYSLGTTTPEHGGDRTSPGSRWRRVLRSAIFRDMMRDIDLSSLAPADSDYLVRQRESAARFHLARLAVAERLAQLDGQPAPAAAADLVPRYLPTEPLDPFTSAPFVRSPKGGFHSVGPDGVDDAATILFDSSKGTTSTGDIFLRR